MLAALVSPPCAGCGRVLDQPLNGAVCAQCWASITPHASPFSLRTIVHAQAIGPYEGTLRDLLHALKYDGRRSIAPRLSAMMASHGAGVLAGADAVVPVPLHRRRQRQRGFNQADDLARGLGLPTLGVLRRVRSTVPQVDLPAVARHDNMRNAFAVTSVITAPVVVLVDDVATTGATLDACARALKAAGVQEVRALTAARVATLPR